MNAIERLRDELPRKRVRGTIGTGSMSDPYTPAERRYNLTGQALEVIAEHRFPVHIITKSDLVLKDLATLQQINQVYAAVSFTITTTDDELARRLEPGAPSPSRRLKAMATLAAHGIYTGITLMPVLPYITDTDENLIQLVEQAHTHGAAYILPGFGMTLRDRQRAYYYEQLDRHFPGLRPQYEHRFGEQYHAPAREANRLNELFNTLCEKYSIATRISRYDPQRTQLSLF